MSARLELTALAGTIDRNQTVLAVIAGPKRVRTAMVEALGGQIRKRVVVVDVTQFQRRSATQLQAAIARLQWQSQNDGAVHLFDEADALFGKRTNVQDSHDRYADTEISTLAALLAQFRGNLLFTCDRRPPEDNTLGAAITYAIAADRWP